MLSSADGPDDRRAFLLQNPGCSFVAHKEGRLVGNCLCGHDGRRGRAGCGPRLPDLAYGGSAGHRRRTRYVGTSAVTVACTHGGGQSRPFGHVLTYSTFGTSVTTEPAAVVTVTDMCDRLSREERTYGWHDEPPSHS